MIKRNKKGQFTKGNKPTHGFKKGIVPWSKSQKGVHLSPNSEFKKGMTPWNKGLTIKDKRVAQYVLNGAINKKGQHCSPKTEFKKGDMIGDKNNNWKGNRVGYYGLHTWIFRQLGKASRCTDKNCKKKSKRYEWANKSGKYLRELTDWIELCKICHVKYDKDSWGDATKLWRLNK